MKQPASSRDTVHPRARLPRSPRPTRGVAPYLIGVDIIETARRLRIFGQQHVAPRSRGGKA